MQSEITNAAFVEAFDSAVDAEFARLTRRLDSDARNEAERWKQHLGAAMYDRLEPTADPGELADFAGRVAQASVLLAGPRTMPAAAMA